MSELDPTPELPDDTPIDRVRFPARIRKWLPRDQWWLAQAMTLAAKIGDTRWLIAQQIGQGTPKAFVALLVFWLALLFASFGLFAPSNLTSALTLTLCAVAVAGAVAMFLELEQGLGGIVRISPEPMRQAVKTLEAEPSNQNAP